ncbi:MAG: DUF721 domain-containing protein [Lactobacillaceae bacterium]|jgi:hypothetical protein|nr:DUF721 domain-containing protein [Lactobacillaceae bacterium]
MVACLILIIAAAVNMNNGRKTKDLYSISNIITPFAKKILGKRGFVEVDIIINWDKIVGADLAKYTSPQKIDFKKNERGNGTLYIETISGAFALEVQHKEKIVIEKINAYFGYNAISKLRIIQNPNMAEASIDEKEDENPKKTLVTRVEETYINEMVKDLDSSKLKDVLTKLGIEVASANKKKENDNDF